MIVLLLAIVGGDSARGQDLDSVESARNALDRWDSFPWYDAEKDQVRRVEIEPITEPPQPYDWEWKPRTGGTTNWRSLWEVVQVIFWVLLASAFVLLAILMFRASFADTVDARADTSTSQGDQDNRTDADRIESLSFGVRRDLTDLLGEARRCYQNGNFAEAIIYLFSYQLVQLDRQQLIRLTKGKTNRQYLQEIRAQATLHGLLERTMVTFEDVFFGGRSLERDRFESCWGRLDEFHRLAERRALT